MRYAIAADGTQVATHFGRCQHYLLVDIEDGAVVDSEVLPNPGHQPGRLPRLLAERGVHGVVAGGAGPRAVDLLAQLGIIAYLGVTGSVEDAVAALAAGTLSEGGSICEHGA